MLDTLEKGINTELTDQKRNHKNVNISLLVGAAVSGLMLTAGCGGDKGEGADQSGGTSGENTVVATGRCFGINACKGKGACHVEGKHECAGQNECKGKGFVNMKKADCETKKGTYK